MIPSMFAWDCFPNFAFDESYPIDFRLSVSRKSTVIVVADANTSN